MTNPMTDLIASHSGLAISAPGLPDLSYDGLRDQVARTGAALAGFDIAQNDPVGIVLPNGPSMATCFVSVASYATAAPLNPAYTEDEFAFYLDDLSARAVIVAKDDPTPARAAALRLGIRVIDLISRDAAGAFDLAGADKAAAGFGNGTADIALVLHTSGTTSRPKIVPLTTANICASAQHIATSLALTADDKCLNVMPLFHIHGLIAAVLSSLSRGASICCTPGFDALRFFGWMQSERPTWYTAVPTMHQAILKRADRNAEVIRDVPLRLIRSSSASLPVPVLNELEDTFGAPVIEAYGMTEAAHQMSANPLPPAQRKPGSVGIAAGPEVAIMETGGSALLTTGDVGEIVIRGPNVTPGYQNNPNANADAFSEGWFRTGDQGIIDGDGYVFIKGRLKEIINRGGEKVSPREVDDVLMEHPDVAQVVTFSRPHKMLGEDVAAAVVLSEEADVDAAGLKAFAAERLAKFKVPGTFVFLEEIPKGATGKLQRIGLAEKLGLTE